MMYITKRELNKVEKIIGHKCQSAVQWYPEGIGLHVRIYRKNKDTLHYTYIINEMEYATSAIGYLLNNIANTAKNQFEEELRRR